LLYHLPARGQQILLQLGKRAYVSGHAVHDGERERELGRRRVAGEPDDCYEFTQARSLPELRLVPFPSSAKALLSAVTFSSITRTCISWSPMLSSNGEPWLS
jgi:hypothetical protein